jgi:cytochrome c-type biogenesis protein CcmH
MILAVWLALARAADPVDPTTGIAASADLPPEPPANPPPAPADVDALSAQVASGLRCPVCQALSVEDSRSNSAQNMKDRVTELVAAGYSEEQIRAFFVVRYGEWVLLSPPLKTNLVVWLGPLAVGLLGLGVIGYTASRWRSNAAKPPPPAPPGPPVDDYEARILAEIEK